MKLGGILRALIIIIIIIGGVIVIVVVRGPISIPEPEPPCLVCGLNLVKILGWAEAIIGAITFGVANKVIIDAKGINKF